MHKGIGVILLAAGMIAASGSWRVDAKASSAAAQVAARDGQYTDGSLRKNRAELEDVFADTFIDTNSRGVVRNKAQEMAVIMGEPALRSLTIQDRKVQIYGDAGVVTGQFTATGIADGKTFIENGRFTDVWVKQGGRWVCVAAHSSNIPEN